MQELLPSELKALMSNRGSPCASVFMPLQQPGEDERQDPIRLKNLLKDTEEKLITEGVRSAIARQMLEPAKELLADAMFWQQDAAGLALFLGKDFSRYSLLSKTPPELVVVTDRFQLKPLLSTFEDGHRFYILALSQNQVRLLEATARSVREVELEKVPKSLAEALKYDENEKQLQYHSDTPIQTGSKRFAQFHGHGVGVDDTKDRIKRFFRLVNAGLEESLQDERTPMVLAAVQYLWPIYHEVNTYDNVLEQGIAGNPEELSAKQLRDKAWKIVRPLLRKAQEEAVAQYHELKGTERAASKLEEVVLAASYGRVEVLFVAAGQQRWGVFDPDNQEVKTHASEEPGDEDLLDVAAAQTLANGGTVYAVDPADVPEPHSPLAAVFRY